MYIYIFIYVAYTYVYTYMYMYMYSRLLNYGLSGTPTHICRELHCAAETHKPEMESLASAAMKAKEAHY